MSFSATTSQIIARTKTVTRRLGWSDLKPGDLFCMVEKGQGLKKGEKVRRLGVGRCVSNRPVVLGNITSLDVILEGFPYASRGEFIVMFCKLNKCAIGKIVNRIEFEYVDEKSA